MLQAEAAADHSAPRASFQPAMGRDIVCLRGRERFVDVDIRWKQRFENFDRAYGLLRDALSGGPERLSLLEKEGVVQRFEYSCELAWKTLKDWLEASGIVLPQITPRQVIKEGFAAKVVSDGSVWLDMLNHRNLLSHTYDRSVFEMAVEAIASRYLPAMTELHDWFEARTQA